MRTLIVLMAILLSLGAYFSEKKPARNTESGSEAPMCRSEACRAIRLANPGYNPHVTRD